jgi:hypothetical protein
MALQTEFEFTLPKGYVDGEGVLHNKGLMRLATAKDEVAPLTDLRVQKNRAYLVIILLSRVITKLGTVAEVTPDIVENLFSADLAYLQDLYRRVNEDGTAVVKTNCPQCGGEFDLDLGALGE